MAPKAPPPPTDFESALSELESIVQNMENSKLSLDESIAAYRRGAELLRFCQSALAAAEQSTRLLEGGNLVECSSSIGSEP